MYSSYNIVNFVFVLLLYEVKIFSAIYNLVAGLSKNMMSGVFKTWINKLFCL